MKYKSTRGGEKGVAFLDVLLNGMASDGGLYIPERIPQPDETTWTRWVDLDYETLCFEVLRLYISESEIPSTDLKRMIHEAYASFRSSEVTPLTTPVGNTGVRVLELFHGPTFAFKDVALQLLGRMFEFALAKRGRRMTVVGATSGDTGSAALAGVADRPGINCLILYPQGRTSAIQELQMTAFNRGARNSFACAVEGSTFDDCQAIVKKLFADEELNQSLGLGAVNSINWARILVQIVYFVYACGRVVADQPSAAVVFSVPTGNFGDILAGYYAKRMRLPIEKLVVASNMNDVLPRFFQTGEYRVAEKVHATISPSMDIAVSSNFERYLYYLFGENARVLSEKFNQLKTKKNFQVSAEELSRTKADFVAYSVNEVETVNTMIEVFSKTQSPKPTSPRKSPKKSITELLAPEGPKDYLLCPHSAVGFRAALDFQREFAASKAVIITLATAHVGKFVDSVLSSCDLESFPEFRSALENAVPVELAKLRANPPMRIVLKNDADAVADFLVEKFGGQHTSASARKKKFILLSAVTAAAAAGLLLFLKQRKT